jgi:hypothetical protein
MICIAISAAAVEAIATALPLRSVGYEHERTASGGYFIWLDRRTADKLFAERRRGEDISGVISRLFGSR